MTLSAATAAKRLGLPACLLLLCWAIGNWFVAVQRDIHDFVPLPEYDYWETVAHIPRYEAFDLSVLWEQHYEHRIAIPELFFAADYLLFRGRQILPAVLNVVCQLIALALFAAAMWSAEGVPKLVAFAAICLAAIFLAWPGVTYSLSLPFLLHWFILQVALLSSLLLMARGKLTGAIVAAIVATFSLANALTLWPILILAALLRRESARRVGILTATFVLVTAAFFTGYRNLGNVKPLITFSHPLYLAAYFLRYLSMPFGAVDVYTGMAVGILALLALAALIAIVWRKRLFAETPAIVCAGLCIQTVFTAGMTSMSRIPFDRPWQDASVIPGHYLNISLHFWAALIILTTFVLCRTFPSHAAPTLFLSLFALCAAVQETRMRPWMDYWLKTPAMYRFASLALESGVDNDMFNSMLYYSDLKMVPRSLPDLASRHLAIYSYPRYQWVGKPAADLFQLTPGVWTTGQITWVGAIPQGFKAAGWAAGNWSELVLLDEQKKIIGLGERFENTWPDLAPIPANHASEGWVGFSRTQPSEACVVSRDRKSAVCYWP